MRKREDENRQGGGNNNKQRRNRGRHSTNKDDDEDGGGGGHGKQNSSNNRVGGSHLSPRVCGFFRGLRTLPPLRRRMIATASAAILIAILLCLLLILHEMAAPSGTDRGGGGVLSFFSSSVGNNDSSRNGKQPSERERPAAHAGLSGELTDEQRTVYVQQVALLSGVAPEQIMGECMKDQKVGGGTFKSCHDVLVAEARKHASQQQQQGTKADARTSLFMDGLKPSYLEVRHRRHPIITVAQLEAMATGAVPVLTMPMANSNKRKKKNEGVAAKDDDNDDGGKQGSSALVFTRDGMTAADRSLEDAVHYLMPPVQRAAGLREELEAILAFGARDAGEATTVANREKTLSYLVDEGLGRRRFTPPSSSSSSSSPASYQDAPHLSEKGRELLVKRIHTANNNSKNGNAAAIVPGLWWSLEWDNFTEELPFVLASTRKRSASFTTAAFHFPGGSRFRAKAGLVHSTSGGGVGGAPSVLTAPNNNNGGGAPPSSSSPPAAIEVLGYAANQGPRYVQQSFVKLAQTGPGGKLAQQNIYLGMAALETVEPMNVMPSPGGGGVGGSGAPHKHSALYANGKYNAGGVGAAVVLTKSGRKVPLKASFSASAAAPVSRQGLTHLVFAAHWDTLPDYHVSDNVYRRKRGLDPFGADGEGKPVFVGACDSAVPMVYLLRKMKNVAALSDVAEALAALYLEDHESNNMNTNKSEKEMGIPGVTKLFRDTPAADVRRRLERVLSPAHHALVYKYYFATSEDEDNENKISAKPTGACYTDFRRHSAAMANDRTAGAGATFLAEDRRIDIRTLLDWVQHLPAMTTLFLDGEEALQQWQFNDNTYGSRHLASKYSAAAAPERRVSTTATTANNNGVVGAPISKMEDIDLFLLYDLLGPAGTPMQNLFPGHSGIFYAELARLETMKRARAFAHGNAVTHHLLTAAADSGGGGGRGPHTLLSEIVSAVPPPPMADKVDTTAGLTSSSSLTDRQRISLRVDGPVQRDLVSDLVAGDAAVMASLAEVLAENDHMKLTYNASRRLLLRVEDESKQPTEDNEKEEEHKNNSPVADAFDVVRELYSTVPHAWRVFGSPHEMYTLHGPVLSMHDRHTTALLAADPFLRFFQMMPPATFKRHGYYSGGKEAADVDDNDKKNMGEEEKQKKRQQETAAYVTTRRYLRYLQGRNTNIFFDPASTPLPLRSTFELTVDDDHRHWLDSQRVLHLISVPFPTRWHTYADNGDSIDDGTMTDMWAVMWDFTLSLGEFWETQK